MKKPISESQNPVIVIRGAGLIGLSIGWLLAREGIPPIIIDNGRLEEKASWAAAGMLSAQFEALIEPKFSDQLHALAARSVLLWPAFAKSLEAESRIALHHCEGPTMALLQPGVLSAFRENGRLGGVEIVSDDEQMGSLVPGLVSAGREKVVFPRDGQVDNRATLKALMTVCAPYLTDNESQSKNADILIDCTGWKSEGIRPVKGQMLSLKPRSKHPLIPIRWGASYIVPKPDRTIIGATVEPDETDLSTDENRLMALLDEAVGVLPHLEQDLQIIERWSGLRPMSPNQRPIIGWKEEGRHYIATGHYRNGILLAPATAELVVSDILGRTYDGPSETRDLRPAA